MSTTKRRTSFGAASALALTSAVTAPIWTASCAGDEVTPSVRSLERVGQFAVVCFGPPGSDTSLRPLYDCDDTLFETPTDFGTDGSSPHVYAIVTLETRGELAVIDLSTKENSVLDFDPTLPGETPLPVGAAPVDVVATPKGTAVFVASADPSRPTLAAISGEVLRPCEVDGDRCDLAPFTVSSWPTCKLPSIPTDIALIADPAAADGGVRASCDGAYEVPEDGPAFGDIDREGFGRQLLYVTLPREGRVAVYDAQALFASSSTASDDCVELASVSVGTTVPPVDPPSYDDTAACALPKQIDPVGDTELPPPAPSHMAVSIGGAPAPGATGGRVFVSDLALPLIHILDVSDPCAPVLEANPLHVTSAVEPSRRVVTSHVSVSPLTPSGKRYLYAIDVEDRSLAAFDVTNGASPKVPLERENAARNPFQPLDRVKFAAAPTDVSIVVRDEPRSTGGQVAAFGTLCDPDPGADTCQTGEAACDLGTLYRSSADYETGAGPFTLRGVFGMVSLATGQVAIVDIEDFDAPCRSPVDQTSAAGCEGSEGGLETTGEPSCNVVLPHQARSSNYLLTNDDVGRNQPGIQTYPSLSTEDGTVITNGPTMVAVLDSADTSATLSVGGDVVSIDSGTGLLLDGDGDRQGLRMNLADPRVHQSDQEWAATYQGPLPGFAGHVGRVRILEERFTDDAASFCSRGVQSRGLVRDELELEGGLTEKQVSDRSARYADRLVITEPLFEIEDAYWNTASCTFQDCRSRFGERDAPTSAREFTIAEAYENELTLELGSDEERQFLDCCFPTQTDYEIRPGDEWVLVGGASGFVHDVIADADTGECRSTCDTTQKLKRSRIRSAPVGTTPRPGDEFAFENALFSFAIVLPEVSDQTQQPSRDMTFRFITQASFKSLRATLTDANRSNVQILSLGYIEPLDEVLVTDGGLEGMILFPGDLIGDLRQFF